MGRTTESRMRKATQASGRAGEPRRRTGQTRERRRTKREHRIWQDSGDNACGTRSKDQQRLLRHRPPARSVTKWFYSNSILVRVADEFAGHSGFPLLNA
jgi:hypothetical protein